MTGLKKSSDFERRDQAFLDKTRRGFESPAQCQILDLCRSRLYYRPAPILPEDRTLMNLIDEEYTRHPFYGSRKLVVFLGTQGYVANRKKIKRLMRLMSIQGICPGPNTSRRRLEHGVHSTGGTQLKLTPQAKKLLAQVPEWAKTKILDTVWCGKCSTSRPMAIRRGFKRAYGLVLEGNCKTCGGPVCRVIESD